MKAIVQEGYGSPDRLKLREIAPRSCLTIARSWRGASPTAGFLACGSTS